MFSKLGCYKLGNALGRDEDTQSKHAISVNDTCEQLSASVCGGCSLEWGKWQSYWAVGISNYNVTWMKSCTF